MRKIILFTLLMSFLKMEGQQKNNSKTLDFLQSKVNLSFAIEGEALQSIGNILISGFNLFVDRYEKDENGDRIIIDGEFVKRCEDCELDYIDNIIGSEFKLDYNFSPQFVISGGINHNSFNENIFGERIENNGYFIETQFKPSFHSNFYIYGQAGTTKSFFSIQKNNLTHAQYATGFGVGNDYYGFDIGANFFGISQLQKKKFAITTLSSIQETYLKSVRIMLRLTLKFF